MKFIDSYAITGKELSLITIIANAIRIADHLLAERVR